MPDIKEIKRQQDTPEATQTEETAEGGENKNNGESKETAAEGAGEPQEDLCATCEHNGECAGKKTHDSGCMGYEPQEDFMNQPEEYEDPQPESMTSLCYSCTQYETCHEKKATVTSCNAYENRTEAYKTDEQRYNEEQARIDAETRRKLRERQQEETMQQGPAEKKHDEITISPGRYNEIVSGALSFLLLKKDGFKVGEGLTLPEYADGKHTGRTLEVKISYVMEDRTGLEDDYCIVGFIREVGE